MNHLAFKAHQRPRLCSPRPQPASAPMTPMHLYLPLPLSHFFIVLCFFFFPHRTAWGILVLQPGIEPKPKVVKVLSPNHWTARKFLLSHSSFPENTSSYFWALPTFFPLTRILVPCLAHLKNYPHFICCSGILSCEPTLDPLPHCPCPTVTSLSSLPSADLVLTWGFLFW